MDGSIPLDASLEMCQNEDRLNLRSAFVLEGRYHVRISLAERDSYYEPGLETYRPVLSTKAM